MYKYLLCWRYLRTRYIALASVISVMLGVATLIVVNSVMAGFSEKMRTRLHGVLSDVVVDSWSMDGFFDHEEVKARIESVAGNEIAAMAVTMETPGMLKFRVGYRVDHAPGADHRRETVGSCQDRRFRRVPVHRSKIHKQEDR